MADIVQLSSSRFVNLDAMGDLIVKEDEEVITVYWRDGEDSWDVFNDEEAEKLMQVLKFYSRGNVINMCRLCHMSVEEEQALVRLTS
ncbi:hypothetical protein [Microseira wollei]|uniref:Uncharacterized protein n=1 Tax=Microseira wollei NIES-4236 TaxID=2530354 RepID=A0AAV3XS75_9CYAN|nr:hypothetical protein [Microseira wollei]GET42657.1 hypothetical protein MiSe_74750 [Microseira wollei NIES-4236]